MRRREKEWKEKEKWEEIGENKRFSIGLLFIVISHHGRVRATSRSRYLHCGYDVTVTKRCWKIHC